MFAQTAAIDGLTFGLGKYAKFANSALKKSRQTLLRSVSGKPRSAAAAVKFASAQSKAAGADIVDFVGNRADDVQTYAAQAGSPFSLRVVLDLAPWPGISTGLAAFDIYRACQ